MSAVNISLARDKMPSIRGRLFAILFLYIFFFSILLARLVSLQLVRADFFRDLAERYRSSSIELKPDRGVIYDRNLNPLALNISRESVYAVPRALREEERPAVAAALADTLSADRELFMKRLSRDSDFAWIARKVKPETADRVRALGIEDVRFREENVRVYPNGKTAAHILGFVDIDGRGLEGLEYEYDMELKGRTGHRSAKVDARRRPILVWEESYLPERDGFDLILTIDGVIQHIAEESLNAVFEKYDPVSASVVVIDPMTGHILAMCNRPTYDLEETGLSPAGNRRNRAVTDMFEPGSSFKIITAGAALEEGIVEMDEEFYCENGSYYVGGRVLHDHHAYGYLSFRDVIAKSSNIGAVKIGQRLGAERLYKYITAFGFGRKTGIDLPGESEGLVRPVSRWSRMSITAIPMGQEIAVTPLQLACAISVIANGGKLMRPYIVSEIRDKNGISIRDYRPKVTRRVLSEKASGDMKSILKSVVETGTGRRARLSDYTTAGKTGTAQRVEEDGLYSHSKFNAVFIGFAPVAEPRIAIAVLVAEPKGAYYGGTVAAPVFAEITDKALRYLGVPPDKGSGSDPRARVRPCPGSDPYLLSNLWPGSDPILV